ncbi:hypothetical protein SV7mr_35040 [Stieleria bergensis]|uniref:Uncharacterized protein n=1 Tax=Stieleria bergensis TaxID=2528025 RepID=A0A517SXU8_9BACT|nr:hypothetical protein SV7mr_35040 [Planctomycetes bacterium SV_7m_r]
MWGACPQGALRDPGLWGRTPSAFGNLDAIVKAIALALAGYRSAFLCHTLSAVLAHLARCRKTRRAVVSHVIIERQANLLAVQPVLDPDDQGRSTLLTVGSAFGEHAKSIMDELHDERKRDLTRIATPPRSFKDLVETLLICDVPPANKESICKRSRCLNLIGKVVHDPIPVRGNPNRAKKPRKKQGQSESQHVQSSGASTAPYVGAFRSKRGMGQNNHRGVLSR